MLEYKILTDEYRVDLETQVNRASHVDWRPIGGLTVFALPSGVIKFYQAMIRETD